MQESTATLWLIVFVMVCVAAAILNHLVSNDVSKSLKYSNNDLTMI